MTVQETTICDVCGDEPSWPVPVTITKGGAAPNAGTVDRHVCTDHFDAEHGTFFGEQYKLIESRSGTPLAIQVSTGSRVYFIGPDDNHAITQLFDLFEDFA